MPLSPQTIERLLAVKAAILAHPDQYNQDLGAVVTPGQGEAGCILGWAVGLFGSEEDKATACVYYGDVYWVGASVLGVQLDEDLRLHRHRATYDTSTEAGRLFNQSAWPDQFTDAEAATAAARIDHFIATDGRE